MNNNIDTLIPKAFPPLLKEIPDPPEKLFLRGDYPDPTPYYFLSVIGSRKHSSYGRKVTKKLISGLRGHPVVIVSGLALGIDALAHKVALEADLKTVAVPGSGLDDSVLYPKTNRGLAQDILTSGGCLLSEFEPDFKATPWSFPKRNRIIAGLAHAILAIEAEERSGTLITTRLGVEYNREVCAVPGPITSPTSKGTNALIQQGATPIISSEEILELFNLREEEEEVEDLSGEELHVLRHLKKPLTQKELERELDFSISKTKRLLSSLEIKGKIRKRLGKIERV